MNAHKYVLAGLLAGFTFSASAANFVTKDWTGMVESGPFAGQTSVGTFTYDQDLVEASGPTNLGPFEGVELVFNFLGQNFTDMNDVAWPLLPNLSFLDGDLQTLDYQVSSGISNPNVLQFSTSSITMMQDGSFYSPISVVAVPEPETYAMMLAGLGLLGLMVKRRQRNA